MSAVVRAPSATRRTVAAVCLVEAAVATVRALTSHPTMALLVTTQASQAAILTALTRESGVSAECRVLVLWGW